VEVNVLNPFGSAGNYLLSEGAHICNKLSWFQGSVVQCQGRHFCLDIGCFKFSTGFRSVGCHHRFLKHRRDIGFVCLN
jgi:hypothetical protein